MLTSSPRAFSRREHYRDLICTTADLVSKDLTSDELMQQIVALGTTFFNASSVEFACGEIESAVAPEIRQAVLRNGPALRTSRGDAMHVPLRFGADVGGVASIYRAEGAPFDDVDRGAFETWTRLLAVRLHEMHLRSINTRLEQLAGIDGLTGIRNRRAFGEMLSRAWQRSLQAGTPLAIAMIDIDFFKAFNDTYGHAAGDACLQGVAQAVSSALREGAVVGRYGGEEFVVFFEDVSLEEAVKISERLREAVLALGTAHSGSSLERVSASIGVAALIPQPGDDSATLLELADHALYGAKARGRNRVVAESYVSISPAATPRHASLTNLPVPMSSFCARDEEFARVRAALEASRLVTLTGFGGVGKSRLALAVAQGATSAYRDGVWYADLAGTRDPDVILELLSGAMGLRDSEAAQSVSSFAFHCATKALLIVLDNCEHLKEDCARFATALLSAAPNARILMTSREPLEHPHARVVAIGPFALPARENICAGEALHYAGVRLFVDRARAVTPFELRDDNTMAVVDLCRRVDGIALGIELAAAQLNALTLEQLRGKLGRRFDASAGRGAGASERGQTLRAVIDWSIGLLAEAERTLLRRLGIFTGVFTFDAATNVCYDPSSSVAVLDALDALVDKSLVVVEAESADRRRFRLFESIRSFARDQLAASGELEELTIRHRDYYVTTAMTACAMKSTRHWSAALAPLEFAADELRAVLELTLGERRQPVVGAEFAIALVEYWRSYGAMREARNWIACAVASADETFSADLLARLRLAMLDVQTKGDAAIALEQASDVLAGIEAGAVDERSRGVALFRIGNAHVNLGDMALSRTYLEAARSECERAGDALLSARVANSLGIALVSVGNESEAIAYFNESERLFLSIGRPDRTSQPLCNLADVERQSGRYEEAIEAGKRALTIAERFRDRDVTGLILSNLGCCYLNMQDLDRAQAFTLDGLRIAREIDDTWLMALTSDVYGRVLCARGEHDRAAYVLGFTDRLWERLNMPRQVDEERNTLEFRTTLQRMLGEPRLAARMAEGAGMTESGMLALLNSAFTVAR